jgi:hypothetical protein
MILWIVFYPEIQRVRPGPTNSWVEFSLMNQLTILFLHPPGNVGTQMSVTEWCVERSLLYCWGCFDSWRDLRAPWLQEEILKNFVNWSFEVHRHRPRNYKLWPARLVQLLGEKMNLLPNDYPNNLSSVPLCILDPFAYQLSPVTEGGGLSNLVHTSRLI